MNHLTASLADSTGFAHRTGNPGEENPLHVWDTTSSSAFAAPVAAPAAGAKVWAVGVPVRSNRATMLIVTMWLDCASNAAGPVTDGYRTSFVVEWSGWNTMYFTVSSLQVVGHPKGLHAVRQIRLEAGSTTFVGTVLELGRVSWSADSPVIPVTPYEDMIVNFLAERMWDRRDWAHTGSVALPAGEESFDVAWMYANLRYLQKPGRRHQTAYSRRMDLDISGYQAVVVFTATDLRAHFSVILEIDGVAVRAIDQRRGLGGGDEIRAPISGRRLTALTLELAQADDEIHETIDVQVASSIRWILLERKGTDPAKVGQAWGTAIIPPPVQVGNLETEILPVGILIGRAEFLRLRDAAKKPGPLKKMADEIIAEAASHLDYAPEQYVGRYLPVDLGNQGCERKVSPWNQMYHFNSCLIYSAVAYALTGDLRYGQNARRALFSTVRCETWQAGFASRIPSGLPGYRAPFIECSTSEAVALCYDFIYPLLSANERKEVEDALYTKGLPWADMYLRLNGEGYLLSSNQGAVYTAGFVSGALIARRSHPDLDANLERGIRWFPRMLNNYYKADGATNEGPGYWEYTTQNVVASLLYITRHQGIAVRDYAPPHLGQTMNFMMHIRSLARKHLSFLCMGDNNETGGYHFMNSSFLFFARYYGDRNALWLWHKFFQSRPNPPGSLFFGKPMCGACSTSGLLNLILFDDGSPAKPSLENAKLFESCERVTLRTGCDHGDILFFFEGGPQTFEHCHSDKGQFIMEAYGERFAADPGVIKYQDPAHLFFKSTSYHNLVTLKGSDQDYRDPKRAVVLGRVALGGACDYVSADLSNSYKAFTKYRRRVLFVRPHYFLILDDVQADEPGLEWNYHSCTPIESIDLASGLIRLQGEAAGMILAIGSPRPLSAATGNYASEGTILTHNLVLSQVDPVRALKIAALLVPYPLRASPAIPVPRVTVSNLKDAIAFEVSGPWGADRVQCDVSGPDAAPGGGPVIQVTRHHGGRAEVIFTTAD